MSVRRVTATVECDACGKQVTVFLDAATKMSARSLYDLVEDAVRGGTATNDLVGEPTSVQDGMMLCSECTAIADKDQS